MVFLKNWSSIIFFSIIFLYPKVCVSIERIEKEAVLRGDWEQVIKVLEKDNSLAADPVARLIMGHAKLATNQNNESLRLFLTVQERTEFEQWMKWTETLLQQHPRNAIAQFLAADAYARSGQMEKAISGFSRALEIKSDFVLALNARGVAHFMNSAWDLAEVDFYMTTQIGPDLADAHANRGTLAVMREVSIGQSDAGLQYFNRALNITSDFALAVNGRGCLHFGGGDFGKAQEDFQKAKTFDPSLVVAGINLDYVSAYATQLPILVSRKSKPGMSLSMEIEQQLGRFKAHEQELRGIPDERTIQALPHMSSEDLKVIIDRHGWVNVKNGIELTINRDQTRVIAINQEGQKIHGKQKVLGKLLFATEVLKTIFNGQDFKSGLKDAIAKESWGKLQALTEKQIMGGMNNYGYKEDFPENFTKRHVTNMVIDAADPNPIQSTINSTLNIGHATIEDKIGAVAPKQQNLLNESRRIGLRIRNLNNFMNNTYVPLLKQSVGIEQSKLEITHIEKGKSRNPFAPQLPIQSASGSSHSSKTPTPPPSMKTTPIDLTVTTTPSFSSPPYRNNMPSISRLPQPPGGVDTEIKTYFDKGNWPVLTTFGLLYPVGISPS